MPTTNSRTPVQLTGSDKVCVLVHRDTKRILCFCLDDPFANNFVNAGYQKIEINHAHELDKWSRKLREQNSQENEVQDRLYLEREDSARQRLRQELKDRLGAATSGPQRRWIETALRALDRLEARKRRYRGESFQVSEGYEAGKVDGEAIARKIICNE